MWPRRCTSAICARPSSVTPCAGCSTSSVTGWCARTTSATGAPPSGCSSSTCSTWGSRRPSTSCRWRPRHVLPPGPRRLRRRRRLSRIATGVGWSLLQSGDEETLRLWRVLVGESVRYFDEVYQKLEVLLTHDDVVGESFYNPVLPGVVDDLRRPGLLVDSEGALCVFPAGFVNRNGDPLPLIVQKADGGFGYASHRSRRHPRPGGPHRCRHHPLRGGRPSGPAPRRCASPWPAWPGGCPGTEAVT